MKQKISSSSEELNSIKKLIEEEASKETLEKEAMVMLLTRQHSLNTQIDQYRTALEKIYEEELNKLIEEKKAGHLNVNETKQLQDEIDKLKVLVDFEPESPEKRLKDLDLQSKLRELPQNLQEECPLIYNIIEALLISKSDGIAHEGMRVRSAVHALAILLCLRSQRIQNSFKLMFTAVCVSYGAGEKFITMLNHLGPTFAWRTFVQYLDKRLKAKKIGIFDKLSDCLPIILLMDNINMYRGKKKHLRLFKNLGPTMWNFTGEAVIVPDITKTKQFLNYPQKCLKPQKDVLSMEGTDLFIDKEPAKDNLWQKAVDQYILELLNDALNMTPAEENKPLNKMDEKEVTEWLKSIDLIKADKNKKFLIEVPKIVLTDRIGAKRTDENFLPLSLEDNSTIAGTMKILKDFRETFHLPDDEHGPEYLPIDKNKVVFDYKMAREHFELLILQQNHQKYMSEMEDNLRSSEKDIQTEDFVDDCQSPLSETFQIDKRQITLDSQQRLYRELDEPFWEVYNKTNSKLLDVIQTNSQENYIKLVNEIKKECLEKEADHLKRTLLHVSVELQNIPYSRFLVDVGCLVNAKEGCGLTIRSGGS